MFMNKIKEVNKYNLFERGMWAEISKQKLIFLVNWSIKMLKEVFFSKKWRNLISDS